MHPFTRAASALALAVCCVQGAQAEEPYLGEIRCFAGALPNDGAWLPAQGQLLPIQQHQALYAVVGISFGGNGFTTFALPDLRERTVAGTGSPQPGQGVVMGEKGSKDPIYLTTANLPPHTHVATPHASQRDATLASPVGKVPATKARTTLYADPDGATTMAAVQTSVTGKAAPIQHEPPYLALNCAIAVRGIFPSRD